MQDTFSDGWRSDGRGFWTKRKKTATSLLSVLALVAGIAVAYKLFDRTVPDNVVRDAATFDFLIEKQEAALGDEDWVEVDGSVPEQRIFGSANGFNGPTVDQFPGDTRTVDVRLTNTNNPARNASFQVYVTNIRVRSCVGLNEESGVCEGGTQDVPIADGPGLRFLNFWTFAVDREMIFVHPLDEHRTGEYENACSGGLQEINQANPCDLGMIKSAGSTNNSPGPFSDDMDERLYRFKMTEEDDGTDQSDFKGWRVVFDLVFSARVPAIPDDAGPVGTR